VVARDRVVDEVRQKLRVGTHVLDAAHRIGGNVVEVHERVVVDVVPVAVIAARAVGAVECPRAFVLLVGLPRDPGRLEHVDEVARGALVVLRREVVVGDVEVRPGLEPEVVGQARVHVGRVVVLLRVRGDRQQLAVDVRGRRAATDARPVGVLHQDEEHRADGRRRLRRGGRAGGGRVGGGGRGGGGGRRGRGGGGGRRGRGPRGGRGGGRRRRGRGPRGGRGRGSRRRDRQAERPLCPAVPVDDDEVRLPRGHRRRDAGGAVQAGRVGARIVVAPGRDLGPARADPAPQVEDGVEARAGAARLDG